MKEPTVDPIGSFEQGLMNTMARCREFGLVPDTLWIGARGAQIIARPESVTEEGVRRLGLVYGRPMRADVHRMTWCAREVVEAFTVDARTDEEFARWIAWSEGRV